MARSNRDRGSSTGQNQGQGDGDRHNAKKDERRDRLAAALRSNLRRRKAPSAGPESEVDADSVLGAEKIDGTIVADDTSSNI